MVVAPGMLLIVKYIDFVVLGRPSMGAEVGRFECFVFLFFNLVCRAFCFCFWGQ